MRTLNQLSAELITSLMTKRQFYWLFAGILGLIGLSGCGGGDNAGGSSQVMELKKFVLAESSNALTSIEVSKLTPVSERRIDRTTYEYEFQVSFKNNGEAARDVLAEIIEVASGTIIISGKLSIDFIAAGATVTLPQTVRLRQDRRMPFDSSKLKWKFSTSLSPVARIPGAPTDLALNKIEEYDALETYHRDSVEFSASGDPVLLRSKLIIGFQPTATVSQVNGIIEMLNATLARTYKNTPIIELKISDPGGLPELNVLIHEIETNSSVRYAFAQAFRRPTQVPQNLIGQPPGDVETISHHLAVGAGAAWNTHGADGFRAIRHGLNLPPVFLIQDEFDFGEPARELFSNNYWETGTSFSNKIRDSRQIKGRHGYKVLGIAAATFDSTPLDFNKIAGIYHLKESPRILVANRLQPGYTCILDTTELPECHVTSDEEQLRSHLLRYVGGQQKIIINTSYGYKPDSSLEVRTAKELQYWRDLLSGSNINLENFIHFTAAGNHAVDGFFAKHSTPFARGAVDGSLTNTAAVEWRQANPATFAMDCLNDSATSQGTLSAIGNLTGRIGVYTYKNVLGEADYEQGSSLATPQAAGLAATFWTIRSDISSSELVKIIVGHAKPESPDLGCSRPGAPLIDAYATLLAADDSTALSEVDPASIYNAPVRLSILDVDNTGLFTKADVDIFIERFSRFNGASAFDNQAASALQLPGLTKKLDPTRFDLNGDGQVGGGGIGRFNLNISYVASSRVSTYETVTYSAFPGHVVEIDEGKATDLQILCYYVFSRLFNEIDGTRADVEKATRAKGMSCVGEPDVAIGIVNSIPLFTGIPTVVKMSGFYETTRETFKLTGNSTFCNEVLSLDGKSGGERGAPYWSDQVAASAIFYGARQVTGMPYRTNRGIVNRDNCSSSLAYLVRTDASRGEIWFNATGRAVLNSGGILFDSEYQIRYYSGSGSVPDASPMMTIGTVPNAGDFTGSLLIGPGVTVPGPGVTLRFKLN